MSNWAKSVSYRDALNFLQARLTDAIQQTPSGLSAQIASLDGYLFAINAAPATVSPTEWLSEWLPVCQQSGEAPSEPVNALISYAQHCKARMEQQKYALPDEKDAVKALTPNSALNAFSKGFEAGYEKVKSIWSALLDESLVSELDAQVFALRFFASTDHAKKYLKDRKSPMRPDQLADQVLASWPKAADLHVRLGMATEMDNSVKH